MAVHVPTLTLGLQVQAGLELDDDGLLVELAMSPLASLEHLLATALTAMSIAPVTEQKLPFALQWTLRPTKGRLTAVKVKKYFNKDMMT